MWNKNQTQTFIQLPELLKPTLRDPKISTVSVLEQIKAAVINLISQLQCILEGIVGQLYFVRIHDHCDVSEGFIPYIF